MENVASRLQDSSGDILLDCIIISSHMSIRERLILLFHGATIGGMCLRITPSLMAKSLAVSIKASLERKIRSTSIKNVRVYGLGHSMIRQSIMTLKVLTIKATSQSHRYYMIKITRWGIHRRFQTQAWPPLYRVKNMKV